MFVLADKNVNVIRHDRASITRVTFGSDNLRKAGGNASAALLIKIQSRVHQKWDGLFIELPDLLTGGLNPLPAEMKFTEFRKDVVANGMRTASARIVRQPGTVSGPDEMIGNDKWLSHDRNLRGRLRLSIRAAP